MSSSVISRRTLQGTPAANTALYSPARENVGMAVLYQMLQLLSIKFFRDFSTSFGYGVDFFLKVDII